MMMVTHAAQRPSPPVPPAGGSRAVAVMFGVAAAAVLIFGLSFMVSHEQAGASSSGDVKLISMMGERVEISRNLAAGKYTIIDFYADWCVNCAEIAPVLDEYTRTHTDIALRKINIVNWDTPVVGQYELTYLPYLQMYGPSGALLVEGADAVLAELKRRFPSSI
ncbi:MAG: thioredoxin [Acidobacteria bacterium]|nr:MAG: thioredoxin [Acidobacteriota bacterium]